MDYRKIFDEEQSKILDEVIKEMETELKYKLDDKMVSVLARGFLEGKQFMFDKLLKKISNNLLGDGK